MTYPQRILETRVLLKTQVRSIKALRRI